MWEQTDLHGRQPSQAQHKVAAALLNASRYCRNISRNESQQVSTQVHTQSKLMKPR